MDTSEKYILMCKKAQEIQDIKKNIVGDFVWDSASENDDEIKQPEVVEKSFEILYKNYPKYRENDVWLPRQDQLQEILISYNKLELKNSVYILNKWLSKTTIWREFDSWEQIWLVVVMNECFKKRWNGNIKNWENDTHRN